MSPEPDKPLVLHVITGLGDGGAEGVLYRLCAFDRSFTHVVISMMDGGRYAQPLRELGVTVHELGLARGKLSVSAFARLIGLLRRHQPQVVQTWLYHANLLGGIAARVVGIPRIVWGIRTGELVLGRTKTRTIAIARLSAHLSGYLPHAIISCSHAAQESHIRLGYDRAKMRTVNNGYDVSRLAPDPEAGKAFRAELGLGETDVLLGTVARYNPQKDHANLFASLEIVARRRRFRSILVGTGMTADNAELVALIDRQGLSDRVMLLGQRNDISAIMNGIDMHVLSSATEGFPNVVAEAMACGTPSVVTDVGDSAFIVGETGWVAPPFDANRLAGAIEAGLVARGDHEAWQARGQAARDRVVTCFSVPQMIDGFAECWAE